MNFAEGKYFKTNNFLIPLFIFFFSVTFVLFYSSLNNYFLADDYWYLLKISKRSWLFALTQFYSHFDPLPILINKIIFAIWKFSPMPYRLLLFLAHSVFCVLVYVTSIKLFNIFSEDQNYIYIKSLMCAVIFSIMFIHTENIIYINAHHEMLFSVFFIAALFFYAVYKQNRSRKNRFLLNMFFMFALLSKENAMIFLILIITSEFIFFRSKFIAFIKNYYSLLVIFVFYLIIRIILYDEQKLGLMYSTRLFDILVESIKNIFFTFTAFIFSLDFIQIKDLFKAHKSNFVYLIADLITLYPITFFAIILTIAIYIVILIKRNKIINFGFLFIFITIIPFMWLVGYERYLYLPSFGFALLSSEYLGNLYIKKKSIYKNFVIVLLSFFFIYNIYSSMVKKENYEKASEIAFNGINEIVKASTDLPLNSDVYFRNLPDNYNGAWIFRDGVPYFSELYLNRIDLKFYKIYEEDVHTDLDKNIFVFNYNSGKLTLENNK